MAYFYFVPLGKISYKYDFSKSNYIGKGVFNKFGPKERIIDKNKIIGDPTYFYIKTFRNFSSAKLNIKYKIGPKLLKDNNFLNIESGVLVDKDNWRYKLYPVYNNVLEDVLKKWQITPIDNENNLFFAQKEKKFANYLDFLKNNDFSSVVFYNYNLNYEYLLPDYKKTAEDKNLIIEKIRGSYSFYIYIKEEDLKIDFSFWNKNINNQQDLSIYVYYQDNLIFNNFINSQEFNNNSDVNFSLNLPSLPEGVYKVEIKANDDFITKKIYSNLSKLSFINRLWLSDLENGFEVFSNKNNFRIKSLETDCLGEIKINEDIFLVNKIYQQFNFKVKNNNLNQITSNSCGLLIENNGLFSFSRESFFDPTLGKLEENIDINNINFIIASYKSAEIKNGYYNSEIYIDLENVIKDKDGYNFIISTPFLKNLDPDEYIEIKEIKIELWDDNIFKKIFNKLKNNLKLN